MTGNLIKIKPKDLPYIAFIQNDQVEYTECQKIYILYNIILLKLKNVGNTIHMEHRLRFGKMHLFFYSFEIRANR